MDAHFATSSSSKRLQSRSDTYIGFEDIDVDDDDDMMEEFPCPFCVEYYDIFGLCCHIDEEHSVEAENGVCPVCSSRVGIDMVAHITLQHGSIFKMQHKRKTRKGGAHSTLSLLRKELREGKSQSLFGSSSFLLNNVAADPVLSSFILPMADDFVGVQPQFSTETCLPQKSSEKLLKRKVHSPPLSVKDKEEKTKRCDFVQECCCRQSLMTGFEVSTGVPKSRVPQSRVFCSLFITECQCMKHSVSIKL